MPTVIGVIFFCFGAYFYFCKEGGMLGMLIVASVFEASSAFNIFERGIQPYYVIAGFMIVRALANRFLDVAGRKPTPQGAWLLTFGMIAVASAFVLPVLFAGTPVYDPKVGIDDGLLIHPPLSFGLNNIAQAGFLACSIAVAFSIPFLKRSPGKTRKGYICAFYIVLFVVFAQSFCQLTGIPFPYSLLLNNPGYNLWSVIGETSGTRNPGTFTEPSLAGGLLVMYCVGFLAEYLHGKGSAARVLLALAALGATASSGSLLALCILVLALLIAYNPFRLPWHFNPARARRAGWIVFLVAAPIALLLLFSGSYRETLLSLTLSKGDSGSFVSRTAADLYALQLLLQTRGIGVGLGSNRSSAMLPSLLSNVGVAGVVAFGMFFFRLFAGVPAAFGWLRWAALGLFLNMCIGIADITFPVFWIPIFLAIECSTYRATALPAPDRRRYRTHKTPAIAGAAEG